MMAQMIDCDSPGFILLFTTVIGATPLVLLMWYGGHRYNLKKLANGEPVIHVPDKEDEGFSWRMEERNLHYYPRTGPLRYIGATGSAGMLRRWSIFMASVCFVAIACEMFCCGSWWMGAAGYTCLLLGFLYLDDERLIQKGLRLPVMLFASSHLSLGAVLMLSCLQPKRGAVISHAGFLCGAGLSLLAFVYLTTTRVPPDDIIHQIAEWKRNPKHKKHFFER